MDHRHDMLISILTDKPKKQIEIQKDLYDMGYDIKTRQIRELINDINKEYIENGIEFVIISNSKGTFISTSEEDIRKYNENKRRHALSELYMSYNMNKRLNNKDNITFEEYMKEVNV